MKLHHLGYAVSNIERSRAAFEALGYVSAGEVVCDASRNCNILFMRSADRPDDALIELVATADRSKSSPVSNIPAKAKAQLYHPCYEVEDIRAAINELSASKWHLIDDVKSAPAIGTTASVLFCTIYTRV